MFIINRTTQSMNEWMPLNVNSVSLKSLNWICQKELNVFSIQRHDSRASMSNLSKKTSVKQLFWRNKKPILLPQVFPSASQGACTTHHPVLLPEGSAVKVAEIRPLWETSEEKNHNSRAGLYESSSDEGFCWCSTHPIPSHHCNPTFLLARVEKWPVWIF